jgi:hypothetical protein
MEKAIERRGDEARVMFATIGVLMSNPRTNKAMHPTNLHVNKSMYPKDTVNDKLPDPEWLTEWLNHEIEFDDGWERKVSTAVLASLSNLLGRSFSSTYELLQYKQSLVAEQPLTAVAP